MPQNTVLISLSLLFAATSLGAAQLPLVFERNAGQAASDVLFVGRGGAENIALLHGGGFRIRGIEVGLAGANPHTVGTGLGPLPGRTNYFIGGDPRRWRAGIAQFAQVRYRDVYPGIDLVFRQEKRAGEYDFIVAPQSDPARIRLEFRGNARPSLDHGDLVLPAFRQKRPHAYQILDGQRRDVAADFVLCDGSARFRLGPYDHRAPLVIDPVIVFASYLGGSGTDLGYSVGVDAAGNIYVAGSTNSLGFPVTPGLPENGTPGNGVYMAFVTKLSPDGSTILYSTVMGGSEDSWATGMVVDAGGNAYVTGIRNSAPDFPTTAGAYQTSPGFGFIAKINPAGDSLLYSAAITASIQAIAVDATGAAYVTGSVSSNFVSTSGAYQNSLALGVCAGLRPELTAPCLDAFVLKLRPDGSAPVYATFLGGSDTDAASAIAVDAAGNAIVTGSTQSSDFPITPNAIQSTYHGTITIGPTEYGDAFVTKLNAAGSGLVFSTYLGGSGIDYATALALGPAGEIYVAGPTQSADFPTTTGAWQTTYGPPSGAFVSKIGPAGSLVYSTFMTPLTAIALDQAGYVYMKTDNPPLAATAVPYLSPAVAILNPAGNAIVSSGAPGVGLSGSSLMVLDGKGFVYQTGQTSALAFFGSPGAAQPNYNGGNADAFVIKIAMSGNVPAQTTVASAVNAATGWPGLLSVIPNGTVAPGEVIAIYGSLLGPDIGVAAPAGATAPTSLGGTRVLFDGVPAPLLWVGSSQINAVAPFAVQAPSTAMTVEVDRRSYGPWKLPVAAAVPGIFTLDSSGNGQAAVINQDGTPNSPSNPAARGSVISIYATGAGAMNPPMTDGSIAPSILPLPSPLAGVSVEIDGLAAQVQYAGAAPGLVAGVIQVNAVIPGGAQSGNAISLLLDIGGYLSYWPFTTATPGRVTIAIQ